MSSASRFGRVIRDGALQGALAGVVYATAECAFAAIAPWLAEPSYSYHGVGWSFSAFLFVFYPIVGAALVAALAAFVEAWPRRTNETVAPADPELLATLVLVGSFGFSNVSANGLHPDTLVSTALVVALMMAALVSLRSRTMRDRLRPFVHPTTASLILVGQPWVAQEISEPSLALKGIAAASFVVMVACAAWLVLRGSSALSPRWVAVVALGVLAVSAWPRQTVRVNETARLADPDAGLPNVVLIVLDTVRADHLSVYGYDRDTTPNLAELARDATVYTRAMSASDMTLPSHASLFSGLNVREHGAGYLSDQPSGHGLDDEVLTLAEILGGRGYRTVGVAANFPVLGHGYGLDQGFDEFDERAPVSPFSRSRRHMLRERIRAAATSLLPVSITEVEYRRADEITESVADVIAASSEDPRPLFVFANYMDAHWPYNPPPPFDTRFAGKLEGYRTADYYALQREVLVRQTQVSDRVSQHLNSQYDGGIAFMDEKLGELMTYLRHEGLYEDTLIVITSDHGEAFGEGAEINHGVSVAQHQIGIPLIIKYPGEGPVGRSRTVTGTVDVLPTILDVLRMETPDGLSGESLLASTRSRDRTVVSESYPEMWLRRTHPRFDRVERAMIVGDLKFVASSDGQMRLFDLGRDPHETTDIYSTRAGAGEYDFPARLDEWLASHEPGERAEVTLDERTMQKLRALGYIR